MRRKKPQEGIWYEDHRMDFNGITDERVKKNLNCAAAIMLKDNLIDEKNGFSRIKVKNYGDVFNLNEIESFYDQPISSGRLWSGFLVKKDIIATARHCVRESTLKELRIVFGYKILDQYTPVTKVSNENVYNCVKIISLVYTPKNNGADWALLQLDREVQGQEVVELSKDDVAPLQPVYVIGHPVGLPLKYAAGARVRSVEDALFLADQDLYMGNCGSPVFNSDTHEVIGIVVRDDTRDFRRTKKGWVSIIYPNSLSRGSQCKH